MTRLEEFVRAYPKTCAYLIVVTTMNFLLGVVEAFR